MPSFSDLVKQARYKKGWTQEELAREVEMSQAAISAWELDASYPSLPVIVRLLKAMKIDLTKIDTFIKPAQPKVKVKRKRRK